jgi:hypothetical protein
MLFLGDQAKTSTNEGTKALMSDDQQSASHRFDRRMLLKASAAVAGTTAVLGVANATPANAHGELILRSQVGASGYVNPTRYRTAYTAYGQGSIGVHPSVTSFYYNPTFYNICGNWVATYESVMLWQTGGNTSVSWIGCAGVHVDNGASNHTYGNAFDLTHVRQSNGGWVDCNYSHRSYAGVGNNRRYAGLAWSMRKHMPEVGIVGSDSSHANHIHGGRYKNGSASLLLTKGEWDTWLMQYACKAFMGVPIALDGIWGPQTQGYYNELKRRLGISSYDPFTNVSHLQSMAHMLVAHGVIAAAI